MTKLSRSFVFGILLTGGASSAQEICPYTFDPIAIGPQALEDAVFYIGKDSNGTFEHLGTAYLIDSNHRFLITAAHVIKHANVGDQVDARSDTFIGEKFRFEIVGKNAKRDLSFLKVASGDIPTQVRAFEVRTKIPKLAESLNVIGHPLLKNDYARTYSDPTYRRYRNAIPLAGTLELESHTLEGASGSPVFDVFGRVVGTVTNNTLDSQLGFARPSHDLHQLLDSHYELSSFGKRLRDQLKDASSTVEQLVPLLESKPTNASNLDLMKIARELIESPEEYPETALALFACPILQSMLHRGLTIPGGVRVVRMLEGAKNAATDLGDQYLNAGDLDTANAYYSLAYEASVEGVRHLANSSSAWADMIRCVATQGQIGDSVSLPNDLGVLQEQLLTAPTIDCDEVQPSNRIGRLLADAARAKYSQWQTGDNPIDLLTSRRTAALAVVLSDNNLVMGHAYSVLGVSAIELGRDDEARRAFGLAYINGLRQPWLEESIKLYEVDPRELQEKRAEVIWRAEIALKEDPRLSYFMPDFERT